MIRSFTVGNLKTIVQQKLQLLLTQKFFVGESNKSRVADGEQFCIVDFTIDVIVRVVEKITEIAGVRKGSKKAIQFKSLQRDLHYQTLKLDIGTNDFL